MAQFGTKFGVFYRKGTACLWFYLASSRESSDIANLVGLRRMEMITNCARLDAKYRSTEHENRILECASARAKQEAIIAINISNFNVSMFCIRCCSFSYSFGCEWCFRRHSVRKVVVVANADSFYTN